MSNFGSVWLCECAYERKHCGIRVFESSDTLTDSTYSENLCSKITPSVSNSDWINVVSIKWNIFGRRASKKEKKRKTEPLILHITVADRRSNWIFEPVVSKSTSKQQKNRRQPELEESQPQQLRKHRRKKRVTNSNLVLNHFQFHSQHSRSWTNRCGG